MNHVFVSYSHKDQDWVKNWFLPRFETNGFQTYIDFRDFEIGTPSLTNMERAVETCAKTILVCSPNYVASEFSQLEAIMLQTEDPIGLRKKILPLMLDDCQLPKRLKIFTYADFRDRNEWELQLRRLKDQIKKDFEAAEEKLVFAPPDKVDTVRLPETGFELFGRQTELKMLHDAWESDQINVISFIAYGGTGKSTLVNKWLEKMRWDNYRSAKRVYAWSFYSQGTGERVTSADQFINHALNFFGDPDPTQGSPWDKGKRLASLIRADKTLLILDGLEPLQSDLRFEYGKIKDPALAVLVSELAKANPGLCVITSRVALPEMLRYPSSVRQVDLEQISDEAGRALLRVRGVRGSDAELEGVTRAFGNHALAINLLAEYLHTIPEHPAQAAHQVPDLDIPEKEGKYPRRVMEALAVQFGEGAEQELLCVLGLFDRPAAKAAIDAVIQGKPIKGLTAYLSRLSEGDWLRLLNKLRDRKLIARESKHRTDVIDCHPLVREHFGSKLREKSLSAWRSAHSRLYEYYKKLPGKELPDKLEEMEPLFAAVAHGCQAGKHQEVFDDVYWKRISRSGDYFAFNKLGAFGSDIAALHNFFEKPWSLPNKELIDSAKAVALSIAGFGLRALGRLREAAQPMQAGLEMQAKNKNWKNAASAAGNLSELYLTMGEVEAAVSSARQSVDFADRTSDPFEHQTDRVTLADALHHAGDLTKAEKLFYEAESIQKKRQREYHLLYSGAGFHFCDLLLSQGKVREVLERAKEALDIVLHGSRNLLDIALNKLSLGRAYLLEAVEKVTVTSQVTVTFQQAADYLNQAVSGLREAGTQDHLPRGLFARAFYYRVQNQFPQAWEDLAEAWEIAKRGDMKLWLVDYHLEAARLVSCQWSVVSDQSAVSNQQSPVSSLQSAVGSPQSAVGGFEVLVDGRKITLNNDEMVERLKLHVEKAAALVQETGYHRRDPEVLLLEAQVCFAKGDKQNAQDWLQKAKERFNEMGIRCWDWEVQRLEQFLGDQVIGEWVIG